MEIMERSIISITSIIFSIDNDVSYLKWYHLISLLI
nr:MAG TPA: hypothetical protein [Caudoviricetes sp.]